MLRSTPKILSTLLLTAITVTAFAQQSADVLWRPAPEGFTAAHGVPALQPAHYSAFTADERTLQAFLENVPRAYAQAQMIYLPTPEGSYRSFRIWTTPVMAEALAQEYPGITTYTAEATDNHQVTAKVDYTPFGFHAMVYDGARSYLVDPYSGHADGSYIAYYRADYSRPPAGRMACSVGEDEMLKNSAVSGPGTPGLRINGTIRKKYRLALAADSEYCIAVAGVNPTKSAVLAKMVVSINRVNGVYEREFAVTMELIAKEDTLIFNTTAPDPYSNNSGSTMLGQNQATVTARIGSANYDFGHVFSTGGGGIAYQGCICSNGDKARGVTGSANPVGDAFDIDYVAHEMGHQFGAGHTFNANTGSCATNGVQSIAFEPGSGSTIMAYAGICGSGNDYQAHSDAYFHSASLEEISSYITTGTGFTCPVKTTSPNINAIVPPYATTYNIPSGTPFELTAPAAMDATADTLTYCWEERDLGDFTKSLAQTRLGGPLFRSFLPTTSPTRVFPALKRLLAHASTPGEKLPDTSRVLTFRVTERDIYQGLGAFNFPDDAITLNVAQAPTPFAVTAPAGGEEWAGGSSQTITWDVSNTAVAPVSCATVDILLSVDGGNTFPYMLATATPNDGSQVVTLPNPPEGTATARIKVKGSNNVFFNLDYDNFTIDRSTVGVSGNTLLDGLLISPVPAGAELRIQAPGAGGIDGKMINPLGQTVWSGSLKGTIVIPVATLPRGVYYMQLSGGGAQATRTVVLQ